MVAYEQLLKWADIPSLENRRLQDILILMYKVKYNLVPKSISDIFYNYDKKYNLRNADFPIPRYSTVSFARHSIRYLGPYLWGKMRKDLRCKSSLQSFKSVIRTMDITNVLYL